MRFFGEGGGGGRFERIDDRILLPIFRAEDAVVPLEPEEDH